MVFRDGCAAELLQFREATDSATVGRNGLPLAGRPLPRRTAEGTRGGSQSGLASNIITIESPIRTSAWPTLPSPIADPTETAEDWYAQLGCRRPGRAPRWPHREEAAPARPRGLPPATQADPDRQGSDKTSGWAHPIVLKDSDVTMTPGSLTSASTIRACTSPWAARPACSTSTTSSSAPDRSPSVRDLYDALTPARTAHLIGGADVAAKLDAKRAIRQGTELAADL